ncbi:hypothetical protein QWY85_02390, partial [Neolewinella lacunae]|uniref:hypothetical protein n=1 Tax=Neolewinella lacunae TaxID=1517758 RepID=UPI0025B45010
QSNITLISNDFCPKTCVGRVAPQERDDPSTILYTLRECLSAARVSTQKALMLLHMMNHGESESKMLPLSKKIT